MRGVPRIAIGVVRCTIVLTGRPCRCGCSRNLAMVLVIRKRVPAHDAQKQQNDSPRSSRRLGWHRRNRRRRCSRRFTAGRFIAPQRRQFLARNLHGHGVCGGSPCGRRCWRREIPRWFRGTHEPCRDLGRAHFGCRKLAVKWRYSFGRGRCVYHRCRRRGRQGAGRLQRAAVFAQAKGLGC